MGLRGPKPISFGALITTAYPFYDDFWALAKGARRGVLREQRGNETIIVGAQIPGEPDSLIALLEAKTAREVRAICGKSAWMVKQPNSYLSRYLPALAQQFQDAKKDHRYPRSDRTTSIPKKMWFLARALAGAIYGISPRTAVNVIGPGKPEEIFDKMLEGPKKYKQGRRKQ